MKETHRAQSSGLFLMELIFAIFFFSVASAVCVQIFVKSHLLSKQAQALNLAVSECSGIAEAITTSPDSETVGLRLQDMYPEGLWAAHASSLTVYYNDRMEPCLREQGSYALSLVLTKETTLLYADISVIDLSHENSIYTLEVIHHLQKEDFHER
ncbi:MAG: hypothetical protein IJC59_01060 [Lachnospiraceae bacterium]|nr:hypothetical protein [Lachnospiraceae bacterium]